MSCIEVPRPAYGAAPPRWHTTWPVLTCRQATRTSQSEVIGISRISCTTRATSPSRKINPASVAIQASSPAYAALPTTSCAAIRPDRSARIDTLPLFPDPRLYPSGASVESVEQPCDCRDCGVLVEELPWVNGKHQLTKTYMMFLAHWARKLSWKETALSFRTSWEKVCHSVEHVVQWGLENRTLDAIHAIGVDEIQYAKGHKYLTLVYQIEQDCTRLLLIGKDRTVASFEQFFMLIGRPLSEGIEFVCSDMWKPYLRVIRERCPNALNILDRFHIVAKMNDALDDMRAAEARRLPRDGYEPVLHKTRWCVLKRKSNLTRPQPGLFNALN